MSIHPNVTVALRALKRNTLQTSLTILGMTIGVAAVLTMIALGTGAEAAIEDQVRAAGMNLIMVTAGNYKPKVDDDFGGAVEPSSRHDEDHENQRRSPFSVLGSAFFAENGEPRTQNAERLVVPAAFHPEA